MKDALTNSVLYRFWMQLTAWYHQGAIARFFGAFKTHYHGSATERHWQHFIAAPCCRTDQSAYARFVAKLGRGATHIGSWIQQSAIYRILSRIGHALAQILGGGLIGRICRFFGVRGLMIVALSFYLPIDYLLREILALESIASVWDECLILFALLYVCWRRAMQRAPIGPRATPIDGYLILFIAVGFFLMCAVSPDFSIAIAGYRAVVEYMVWFFLMIRLLEDDRDFSFFYGSMVVLAVLLGLHGIYQYIAAVPIPAAWVSQTEQSVRTRVFSITGSPNIMGSLLVLLVPMVAALAYYTKKAWLRLVAIGCTGIICLSILFTFSKGAWGGLVVAVIIFAVFLDRRLIALMGIVGAGALICIPSIANRITYLFTTDYAEASARAGRTVRWAMGLDLLKESNSLLGFGLGRFGGAVAMQNQVLEESDIFTYFYMDNYYLKTLVEMGYIGLIFFIILLIGLTLWCLRSLGRTRQDTIHPLAVGMFAGMMGVLMHCYFENIFEVPYMMAYFWSMAAAIMYLGYFRRKRPEKTPAPPREARAK